jgi:transcriptional regulator with XRE-family HTH domain
MKKSQGNLSENLKKIGLRLKEVRQKLGFTLETIHEKMGHSKSFISEVENGKKKPALLYLYVLASRYNVNVNWLFTGHGEIFLKDTVKRDFGEDRERIEELLYHLEKYDIVRYSILKHFIQLKTEHKELLQEKPD